MSVEVRDILLKAAEDVQQGMWCKEFWFIDPRTNAHYFDFDLFGDDLSIETAQASKRCAAGSIALAAALLGGSWPEAREAGWVVQAQLGEGLLDFNERFVDPFEAGQQLAELFRTTAEAL